MDEQYVVKGTTLVDIADAIREKTGNENPITCNDFANEIRNITPTLQDKNITIRENGVTTLNCDSGYEGLDDVQITVSVGEEPFEYVQDGLVAWFDITSPFDNNEHWNNLVGNDYIYVYNRLYGNSTNAPYVLDHPINANGYCFKTNTEYYKNGYTIEVVGRAGNRTSRNTDGSWLITGDITGTAGVGFGAAKDTSTGYLYFINWGEGGNYKAEVPFNKMFGASVYFDDIIERDNIVVKSVKVSASVNGSA